MRSKFQEAEEHRNRVRAEMAELSNSSDEEKIKLSKCQAEKTLGALVEKRNALEKKASEHVVLQMEVKAEAARLQDTVSGAQDALKGLAEQITERERELRDLNGYLSRLEGTARECEGRLNECEQMRLQEEEEEAALSEEIEAKREAIALQSRKLIANFQKYDQSALAERYGIESKRDTKGSGDTSSSKVIKPSAAVEGMRGGLENSIKLDKDSAEKEVAAMVGQEQLACLEENEEKYLREAR